MDDESNTNLLQKIQQYQNSIIKHSERENDDRILYYIQKLYDMPVTVDHLKETGIGRTMNSLRKYNGPVGIASKAIVNKWKLMVATEEDDAKLCRPPIDITPPDSPDPPSSDEKQKVKSDRKEDKYSKREDSRSKHKHHDSSDRSRKSDERHSKSHSKKEDKKISHKSSHKEKDHRSHKSRHDEKHKKEEKSRENKRKHEEERSSSKKLKYEVSSSDSEDSNRLLVDNLSISSLNSDDNILPDSTTHYDSRENTQSPVEKIERKHPKSDKHDKHRSRDKDKKEINGSSKKSSHKEKEKTEIKKEKSSSSTPSKESKPSSSSKTPEKPKKVILHSDNGIDSGSGASFAEALGMIEPTKSSKIVKKKSSSSSSPTPSTSSSSVKSSKTTPRPRTQSPLAQQSPNLLSPHMKLEPLDNSIVSQLPEITTNYKPLGLNYDSPYGNVKNMSEEEALSVVISSKTQRTKVYSGVKTNWGYVPTLFQLCVRVLQDNIDALEYTGGVPYEILKPVLERATATQLLNAEYYNPYLIEESDELWESHCKRECKGLKRQEMESWREMYLRCRDERDAKLKALTVNIKQSIDKSLPVRQTKLAYVDSVVKPPRGIARKQAKYGTSENMKRPLITPSQRLNSIASGSGEKISVPNPGPRAVSASASAVKPKKAPLMQKTLALMKGRFGRR